MTKAVYLLVGMSSAFSCPPSGSDPSQTPDALTGWCGLTAGDIFIFNRPHEFPTKSVRSSGRMGKSSNLCAFRACNFRAKPLLDLWDLNCWLDEPRVYLRPSFDFCRPFSMTLCAIKAFFTFGTLQGVKPDALVRFWHFSLVVLESLESRSKLQPFFFAIAQQFLEICRFLTKPHHSYVSYNITFLLILFLD